MTKTAAAHHDDLIVEILYELTQHGPQSLIDMIATLIAGLPDPRAEEIASDLERIAYALPPGPLQP